MSVIRFKVDDQDIVSYLSMSQIFPNLGEEIVLIETKFLKNLLNLCSYYRAAKGVVIRGPSATGKTSSASYLFNKLSSAGPLLLCSPQC